jgi:hypothetical protein
MTTHSFNVRIDGPAVLGAHDGKLILDPTKIEPKLAEAIAEAHERESD